MRKAMLFVIGAGVLVAALVVPTSGGAHKGRVVDAMTGKPVEGAYAVGRVEGGGGFVGGGGGCTIVVGKSDANGEFTLYGEWRLFGGPFSPRSRPWVFFYKRGYYLATRSPEDETVWVIKGDEVPVMERLRHLEQIQAWIDCGVEEVKRNGAELMPLYQAMVGEGADIASTLAEKVGVSTLTFWLDVVEVGVQGAAERLKARRELERRAQ